MTLITETGTGITGALSYVSLAEADSHFAALALDDWGSATGGQREQALIRASLHIDSYSYPGRVLIWDQGLKWPRNAVYDRDGRALTGLPHALRTAALELAATFLQDTQGLDGRRAVKERIGALELTYETGGRGGSFVYRLLRQIGARVSAQTLARG
ncbi:hypothetical protein NBZ79_12195 [Sneathiella marina]|uniref:Putative DnaT-like domain-containing protein n=1 Tax=Sneathiella marina TaxID=2950108 RepID=A0ABY4VYD2_9PROT|nr:DnaT-like ssDNA-binding protein [Sneathiella marina]USG59937.1 hypothetical protein NBZ79_12195 [Sneathiella marina]